MPEPRRLRNPPITEAIIDIRVELAAGSEAARLREAESLLRDGYVLDGEQHRVVGTLGVSDDPAWTFEQGESALSGYTFRSHDERFVAQLNVEGIVVSRLQSYTSWEELAEETARLWSAYVGLVSPVRILRLGTRYLNTIGAPASYLDLREYFTTLPSVPAGIPTVAADLLVRMVLHEEEPPYSVIVTQFLEQGENEAVRVILDIDAFSRETYEMDEGAMWAVLTGLRDLKNRVFFGSITEKTLGLFE